MCIKDRFRSIPSLEIKDASVLDEFYWINKEDPNYSLDVYKRQNQWYVLQLLLMESLRH